MLLPRFHPFILFATLFLCITPARAAEPLAGAFADAPGKEVLQSKCFQCHGEGMWKDLRQDRRRWEGVLYRMVGRGALWTEDEINTMAGYLATAFGTQSGKPTNK
jgi:mono/diheme cytochrome c family protein